MDACEGQLTKPGCNFRATYENDSRFFLIHLFITNLIPKHCLKIAPTKSKVDFVKLEYFLVLPTARSLFNLYIYLSTKS
jgi:hypothetical protein